MGTSNFSMDTVIACVILRCKASTPALAAQSLSQQAIQMVVTTPSWKLRDARANIRGSKRCTNGDKVLTAKNTAALYFKGDILIARTGSIILK